MLTTGKKVALTNESTSAVQMTLQMESILRLKLIIISMLARDTCNS